MSGLGAVIGTFVVAIFVGRAAAKRGYSGWLWGIISFAGWGAVGVVILLALRDRSIARQREEESRSLEAQLESRKRVRGNGPDEGSAPTVPSWTIGDLPTIK